jgi:hypothetical protein
MLIYLKLQFPGKFYLALVHGAENVYKVIALVSRAEAVLSTGLYVRAFIYHKPCFT